MIPRDCRNEMASSLELQISLQLPPAASPYSVFKCCTANPVSTVRILGALWSRVLGLYIAAGVQAKQRAVQPLPQPRSLAAALLEMQLTLLGSLLAVVSQANQLQVGGCLE